MSDTDNANADLDSMTFEELDVERARLMESADSIESMTLEEKRRFVEVCHKLRVTARPAGKPSAKPRAKKQPASLDDLTL